MPYPEGCRDAGQAAGLRSVIRWWRRHLPQRYPALTPAYVDEILAEMFGRDTPELRHVLAEPPPMVNAPHKLKEL
jgi:hypothetical protein